MVRKKEGYTPSKYQKKIFDFVKKGTGNAVIEACAGSGKTFTLIKCLDFIPQDKRILFTAFNTDIVGELKEKINCEGRNIDIKTLHSLGLSILFKNGIKGANQTNGFKYSNYIRRSLPTITDVDTLNDYSKAKKELYVENLKNLIEFCRLHLCQTEKDVNGVITKYGISVVYDEPKAILKIMEWGKTNTDEIDYTDMVWLPYELNLPSYVTYDWIFIDEVQDENAAQRELILRCRKMSTRFIAAGDPKQQLYVFNGADSESFEQFKKIPHTKLLPLSISYRCADTIVDFAKRYAPSIERNSDKREGVIVYEVDIRNLQDGDMVLCRTNAPLDKLYTMLLQDKKKAFIRGKNIGKNLLDYVKSFKQKQININLRKDGLFVRMYEELFSKRDKIMKKYDLDEKNAINNDEIQKLIDNINAIDALSQDTNSVDELCKRITEIFSDDKKQEGISLSTIHKAKGLEADRVYILCSSLMPSKQAKLPWELSQEKNLMYVAYTRAKNVLGFLNEDDFSNFTTLESEDVRLQHIEKLVNDTLGKKKEIIVNKANVSHIIQTAKEIIEKEKNQVISMPRAKSISASTNNGLGIIVKAKKKKKK